MMEKSVVRIINKFRSAVMAGICISIGCVVYLRVGEVAGAVLFAFGLLAVVHYHLNLYTGMAGFVGRNEILSDLSLTLIGNIVGCVVCAVCFTYADDSLQHKCIEIVASRNRHSLIQLVILASGCGFIMTTAVKFARKKKYLPLLFGVPVFILCGFCHSIADAFYFSASGDTSGMTMASYVAIVIGNYLGCNAYKLFLPPPKKGKK